MSYVFLDNKDLDKYMSMEEAIKIVEKLLNEKNLDTLITPPEFSIRADKGALVFTPGGSYESGVIGTGINENFHGKKEHDQLVTVYDINTGQLKGIVISNYIHFLATGAMGAVAIKLLSRNNSRTLGLIGTGLNIWKQLEGAVKVRKIEKVLYYDMGKGDSDDLIIKYSEMLSLNIEQVTDAQQVVENSDIIITATRSHEPVFNPKWLKPGTHINTVGPYIKDAQELDEKVAQMSKTIAIDSIEKIKHFTKPFFLIGVTGRESLLELNKLLSEGYNRESEEDITLFCSVGLAGAEVVLASEAINKYHSIY